jgi:hypothetical protein
VELTQHYTANPSTSVIWDHIISLVQQQGSFVGMLQVLAGPLLHQYLTPAFQPGLDLQYLRMNPAEATAYSNDLLSKISAANTALFGPSPQPPSRPFLLQNTVDWLCGDVDAMKLALAAPEARAPQPMPSCPHCRARLWWLQPVLVVTMPQPSERRKLQRRPHSQQFNIPSNCRR